MTTALHPRRRMLRIVAMVDVSNACRAGNCARCVEPTCDHPCHTAPADPAEYEPWNPKDDDASWLADDTAHRRAAA